MYNPVLRWIIALLPVLLTAPIQAGNPLMGESRQLRTVVIDPGHGGQDPGAVLGEVREKDLVLSVALRVGNKIKNSYPEVKVIYTRSKDVFIPLHERATIAIKNKADVFISIHANYVAATAVRGTETFTLGLHRSQENLEVAKKENSVILLEEDYSANYQGFDPKETESYIMFENLQSEYQSQSIELASNIQEAFTTDIGMVNRGVKQAGFLVLRQTTMPSVLVEIGFISNPAERKFLVSETGREKISESIFRAFSSYKKTIDQRSRFELADSGEGATPQPVPDNKPAGSRKENQPPVDTLSLKPAVPASVPEQKPKTDASRGEQKPAQTTAVSKGSPPAGQTQEGPATGKSNPGTAVSKPSQISSGGNDVYYSVQIGAGKSMIDPVPANFKGEKKVFRVKVEPYFKFYSGRFLSPEEAFTEKTRLSPRFPDAFVVIFEKGVPRMFIRP